MTANAILGTGVDLVENDRMRQMLERWADKFKDRVFLPAEQDYCDKKASPWMYYAGRFAVKESVSKALGTGIGPRLGWLDIELTRNPETGAPSVKLSGKGKNLAESMGGGELLVSLSHTHNFAIASVLLVAKSEGHSGKG